MQIFFAAVLAIAAFPVAALAQEAAKPGEQPQEPPVITATFKDGFKFRTADGSFEGGIGGRLFVEYRDILDRPALNANTSELFVRTARLAFEATFYGNVFSRVEADFSTEDRFFSLTDGYLGWKGGAGLNVQVGQFKVPFSQEETCSSRFIDFAERSIVNRLVPARDIGAMAFGKLLDERFQYEVGIFNGQGENEDDANDAKDVAARIRLTPFRPSDDDWLNQLRVGAAFTYGYQSNTFISDLETIMGGTTFVNFVDTAVRLRGGRLRIGAELSWIVGPFSLRAEYIRRRQEAINAVEAPIVDWGFTTQMTYLLTGEAKTLENRVRPARPFDPAEGGWGAFELAARVAIVDVVKTDASFLAAVPLGFVANRKATELTGGLNWWLTSNLRWTIDFSRVYFDQVLPVSGGLERMRTENTLLMRWQIDF